MKASHTPGPWKWSYGTGDAGDTTADLHEERYCVGEANSIIHHGADWPMDEANARLIAAAPDLLEALRAALDAMSKVSDQTEAGHMVSDQIDAASAAIAKATA